MMILGEPIQQKTEMAEDTSYLDGLRKKLDNRDIAEFTSEYNNNTGAPKLKMPEMEISFLKTDGFADRHKVLIKDFTEKITRIFEKHEFDDLTYRKAFSEALGSIECLLAKL